eukprot:scaffold5623_cov120-Amphora_coffeaeformis.AAC.3
MRFIRLSTFSTLSLLWVRGMEAFTVTPRSVTLRSTSSRPIGSLTAANQPRGVVSLEQTKTLSRKQFINAALVSTLTVSSSPLASQAALFAKERRQLELCLVAVWRVVYWADSLATDLGNPSLSMDTRKERYLEARLAGKAILTGKIGGGANYKVYTLSTLQLPDCLQDLSEAYNKSLSFGETIREFHESIASLVEFDGMDTLTDPSPRSSLTLTQFDGRKESFVRRILVERVAPLGKKIIQSFPAENVAVSQRYIQQNYANEIFPRPVIESSD